MGISETSVHLQVGKARLRTLKKKTNKHAHPLIFLFFPNFLSSSTTEQLWPGPSILATP